MSTRSSGNHSPARLTRRDALRLAGGAGSAALLGGHIVPGMAAQEANQDIITLPETGASLPTDDVTFRWLDSGDSKALFFEAYFAAFQEKHPNITVQYEGLPWGEIQQIVSIGVQNGNAPDVFQVPQNIPGPQAVAEGWVAPLDDVIPDFENWKAGFPPNSFFEGLNVFNGKTYTFPRSTTKRGVHLLLYNTAYMQQAGYDPATEPLTWDTFRDAARKITAAGQGQYYGVMLPGQQTGRWGAHVSELAQMAGASAGDNNIDWRTGEYVYTSDQYVAAIDLLLALRDDGSVFPGSVSLNVSQVHAQMPQGGAGMNFDGEFAIPLWIRGNPDFQFGVASFPHPSAGEPLPVTYGIVGANHQWLYAQSKYPAIAGEIFYYLGTKEGQTAFVTITGGSDPSVYPEANQQASIDERTRQAYAIFDEYLRLGPDPRVRNPEQSQVYMEMRPVKPDFGEVVQGLFTGQLSDPRAAMQDLLDRSDAELERAIKAAQDKGAQVSRDDWVFPNWDPTRDYTEADYAALGTA